MGGFQIRPFLLDRLLLFDFEEEPQKPGEQSRTFHNNYFHFFHHALSVVTVLMKVSSPAFCAGYFQSLHLSYVIITHRLTAINRARLVLLRGKKVRTSPTRYTSRRSRTHPPNTPWVHCFFCAACRGGRANTVVVSLLTPHRQQWQLLLPLCNIL